MIGPLKEMLSGPGRKVFVMNEAASWWMEAGATRPEAGSAVEASWSAALFRFQRAAEDSVFDYAEVWEQQTGDAVFVLLDRGLMDSMSYQPVDGGPAWEDFYHLALPNRRTSRAQVPQRDVVVRQLATRYDVVLFLPSVAVVCPEKYKLLQASNPHRRETVDQAQGANEALRSCVVLHPNFIEVSPELIRPGLQLELDKSLAHLSTTVVETLSAELKRIGALDETERPKKKQRVG